MLHATFDCTGQRTDSVRPIDFWQIYCQAGQQPKNPPWLRPHFSPYAVTGHVDTGPCIPNGRQSWTDAAHVQDRPKQLQEKKTFKNRTRKKNFQKMYRHHFPLGDKFVRDYWRVWLDSGPTQWLDRKLARLDHNLWIRPPQQRWLQCERTLSCRRFARSVDLWIFFY